ncbi:MAG: radical SAM protein [Candidatus Pacearchaeota archaeon]
MQVKEKYCQTILTRSKICNYCINPYTGCEHACIYCYARFIGKYAGKSLDEWGKFVFVKKNAREILKKDLSKAKNGSVLIGSVCDPYQPLETKCKITKSCLNSLARSNKKFDISIQTKSILILRDLELIKKLKAEVGFTIICDDFLSKELEPKADLPSERIKALKKLHERGIKTYVFVGPIIPKITDTIKIIQDTSSFTDFYYFDRLNFRAGVYDAIKKFVFKHNLQQELDAQQLIAFYKKEKEKIQEYCEKNKIKNTILF